MERELETGCEGLSYQFCVNLTLRQ